MNKYIPWTFGALFIALFIYLIFTEVNRISYKGNNTETKGYVVNKSVCYKYGGRVYIQCIDYIFEVDGKLYKKRKKTEERQYLGNTLIINYSIDNPNKNEILKFNNEFYDDKERAFISLKKEGGHSQIKLINGIYFFRDYIGNNIFEEIGLYTEKSDTLNLKSFVDKPLKKYFFNQNKELVNIQTGIVYK